MNKVQNFHIFVKLINIVLTNKCDFDLKSINRTAGTAWNKEAHKLLFLVELKLPLRQGNLKSN